MRETPIFIFVLENCICTITIMIDPIKYHFVIIHVSNIHVLSRFLIIILLPIINNRIHTIIIINFVMILCHRKPILRRMLRNESLRNLEKIRIKSHVSIKNKSKSIISNRIQIIFSRTFRNSTRTSNYFSYLSTPGLCMSPITYINVNIRINFRITHLIPFWTLILRDKIKRWNPSIICVCSQLTA